MIKTHSREETIELGSKLGGGLERGAVCALRGGLGAGKTTLVQGIAFGLGVEEIVTSPSFTIIAEYTGKHTLYHMDLYRISGEEEFEALGAEELFYGEGIVVIEWSERIEALLPPHRILVSIRINGPQERAFSIEGLQGFEV